jgi:hypothetical protein
MAAPFVAAHDVPCACMWWCRRVQHKGFELQVLDEAFTSEHWIVRIYKVKKPSNTVPTADAPSQHPSKHKRFGQVADGKGRVLPHAALPRCFPHAPSHLAPCPCPPHPPTHALGCA